MGGSFTPLRVQNAEAHANCKACLAAHCLISPLFHTSRILKALSAVIETLPVPSTEDSIIISRSQFAVAVQEINSSASLDMQGQAFSIQLDTKSDSIITANSLQLSPMQLNSTASVYLPPELFQQLSNYCSPLRVAYSTFLNNKLFQRQSDEENTTSVGEVIIAADVFGNYTLDKLLQVPIMLQFMKVNDDF